MVQQRALIAQQDALIVKKAAQVEEKDLAYRRVLSAYEQVKMELAILRRINFAKRSEQLPDLQAKLFEDDAHEDLAELETMLDNIGQQLTSMSGQEHTPRHYRTSTTLSGLASINLAGFYCPLSWVFSASFLR